MPAEECDVQKIVDELIKSGSEDEIALLIFLSKYDAVLLSAIQLALTGGRYHASGTWTKSLLQSLIGRGLVEELRVTIRRRQYKLYKLTDCGRKVAEVLSKAVGV